MQDVKTAVGKHQRARECVQHGGKPFGRYDFLFKIGGRVKRHVLLFPFGTVFESILWRRLPQTAFGGQGSLKRQDCRADIFMPMRFQDTVG